MSAQEIPEDVRCQGGPYRGAVAITPADADIVFTVPQEGVFVTGAGTLVMTLRDGTGPITITAGASTIWPFKVKRIAAASTATGVWGLY